MTYKINGTELTHQPSQGRWIDRRNLGVNGQGAAVYSSLRQFEMKWNLNSPAAVSELNSFFGQIGNGTGTVIVDLPKWAATPYQFESYTGVNLREPRQGTYFSENIQSVTLLVTNIRT